MEPSLVFSTLSSLPLRLTCSQCASPHFPFYKDTSHIGLEPTLYVSLFNAITSITTLPPNKVILWGLGLQQLLGEHSSTHNPSHSLVLFWLAPL